MKVKSHKVESGSLLVAQDRQADEVSNNTDTSSDESEGTPDEVLETNEVNIIPASNCSACGGNTI